MQVMKGRNLSIMIGKGMIVQFRCGGHDFNESATLGTARATPARGERRDVLLVAARISFAHLETGPRSGCPASFSRIAHLIEPTSDPLAGGPGRAASRGPGGAAVRSNRPRGKVPAQVSRSLRRSGTTHARTSPAEYPTRGTDQYRQPAPALSRDGG